MDDSHPLTAVGTREVDWAQRPAPVHGKRSPQFIMDFLLSFLPTGHRDSSSITLLRGARRLAGENDRSWARLHVGQTGDLSAGARRAGNRAVGILPAGLVLLLAFAGPGWAADIPAGNPEELATAISQAVPGDTITLASGSWSNVDILFKASGTSTNPITLRAQSPGQVFLSGASRLRLAGSHLVVDGLVFSDGYLKSGSVIQFRDDLYALANNCRVKNCAIIDYNPPEASLESEWVSLYGFSNRVDHCYFRGKRNAGPLLMAVLPSAVSPDAVKPNFHHVDHNYFGQRPALGQNGAETIRVGDSTTSFDISNTIVEANYFNECSGEAEIISNKSCKNTYRYNTFVDCEGALTLRHGNRCTVQGNFFFGHGRPLTGGVRIMGEGHRIYNNYFQDLAGGATRSAMTIMQGLVDSPLDGYFQVKRTIIAFNTFVQCNNSFLIGLPAKLSGTSTQTTLAPTDCRIANNIVYSSKKRLVDQRIDPVNMVWEGNLMFGSALGIATNSGTVLADPMLVQAPEGIWRPGTNSPALGAAQGAAYAFVTTDIDGQARPAANSDIGCDQGSSDPAVRHPLSEADVGPAWMVQPIIRSALKDSALTLDVAGDGAGHVTVRWMASAGAVYQVQYSVNLRTWHDAGIPIIGSGAFQTSTDTGAVGSPIERLRLFRVLQVR